MKKKFIEIPFRKWILYIIGDIVICVWFFFGNDLLPCLDMKLLKYMYFEGGKEEINRSKYYICVEIEEALQLQSTVCGEL